MGLIKAAVGATGGVLADQWREFFSCDSMPANVLAVRGQKRTSNRSSNTKGNENVISNGSVIAVGPMQCMIITEQGKVAEVCAEPGEFLYDSSTEPSIFFGPLGKGIAATFRNIGKRFTFGGEAPKDQRVYYINLKELIGNKYGTPSPVPFRVVDTNVGLDIDIAIRCFGEFSYHICDPLLFYTNITGNVAAEYRRETLDDQLKTELMTALQPAFARISAMGIRYSALPGHTMELADALNAVLSAKWRELRGIEVVSFGVSSVKASDEDEQMIKELQRNAAFRNPNMAAAHLVGAQAAAMQSAAANEGAGPAMAFWGMNMAAGAGGANAQSLFQLGQQQGGQPPAAPQPPQPTQPPAPTPANAWRCAACGAVNKGKFCAECGAKKPEGVPLYRCDKCGWEPADPSHPPKFCPECGDPFREEEDRVQ
ncbi:MAG: SPFH domain-containing protein [Oscillospiraceae bacterium]|jgi:membrane protease subunit (stomatin/prohibitin family)|nr:SPFH domain-containing protein [Oscillospiraceae bacterium]